MAKWLQAGSLDVLHNEDPGERLGLAHLRPLKKDRLNPWQFASGGHQGLNLLIPPMDNPRKQCQELVFPYSRRTRAPVPPVSI